MQVRNPENPPNHRDLALRADKIFGIIRSLFWETQALARYGPRLLPQHLWLMYFAPGAICYHLRRVIS